MSVDAAELLAQLGEALGAEDRARGDLRRARSQQAALLRALRDAGVPSTLVALRLAAARGDVLTVQERIRLGQRLRKCAQRETSRPGHLVGPPGPPDATSATLVRALSPERKEDPMAKLIRRTITTEEYEEDEKPRRDLSDDVEEDDHEDSDDDSNDDGVNLTPARRRR